MIMGSQDFYLDNSTGLCRPECGKWDQYSPSTRAVVYGVNITFASLIIVVSVATLVLSALHSTQTNVRDGSACMSIFGGTLVLCTFIVKCFQFQHWQKRDRCFNNDLIM